MAGSYSILCLCVGYFFSMFLYIFFFFFFSSRRRHTRCGRDWSSDVCSSDLFVKIDEIAERILTLEGEPLHTYTDYLKTTEISEAKSITDGKKCVEIVVKNFSTLITKERLILSLAADAEDEGTVSLMSDYISETEKTLWMLNSYLK